MFELVYKDTDERFVAEVFDAEDDVVIFMREYPFGGWEEIQSPDPAKYVRFYLSVDSGRMIGARKISDAVQKQETA